MKRQMQRVLSLLLVLCLMSTATVAAEVPEENGVAPCFTYIDDISMGLAIEIDGRAICHTGVTLYNANHSCNVTMVLQRNDGSGWENVKTWTGSGGKNFDIEKSWYLYSGYEYRTENTIRVYNANDRLIESYTSYSPTREY